jgi:hypothetical protein
MISGDTDESDDEEIQAVQVSRRPNRFFNTTIKKKMAPLLPARVLQGIVRSHSFRLGTITEGDVFCPGKVGFVVGGTVNTCNFYQ